jgi:hypothetical protein
MLVPVRARIGIDESPHGHASRKEEKLIGPGSWHKPGLLVQAEFWALFVPRQSFVFFSIYLFCVFLF